VDVGMLDGRASILAKHSFSLYGFPMQAPDQLFGNGSLVMYFFASGGYRFDD
jgi:hypothetical protein